MITRIIILYVITIVLTNIVIVTMAPRLPSPRSPRRIIIIITLSSTLFAMCGFLNGLFANDWDDINVIPTFIMTPLTYLGGIFFSNNGSGIDIGSSLNCSIISASLIVAGSTRGISLSSSPK